MSSRGLEPFASVEILEPRQLLAGGPDLIISAINHGSMFTSVVPGESYNISVKLTNQGDAEADASEIAIRAYFGTNPTTVDQNTDVLLGSYAAPVALPAGTTGTVPLRLTIPPGAATGSYLLLIQIDDEGNLDETDVTNNVAVATDSAGNDLYRTLSWKFGNFDGRNGVKLVMPGALADAKTVTFSLTGTAGYGEIVSNNALGSYDLTVQNTTVASKLAIASAVGDTVLGKVDIQSSLGAFTAPRASVTTAFTVEGALRSLSLAQVGDPLGSDIDLAVGKDANAKDKSTLSASLGSVGNVHLLSQIAIKSLTAVQWLDSVADRTATPDQVDILQAPSISSLKITGASGVAGNFQADVTTTGGAKTALGSASIAGSVSGDIWTLDGAVGKLSVGGTVSGSTVRSAGNMSTVTIGAAVNSDFMAGLSSSGLPQNSADFATKATINTFTVTGYVVPVGQPVPRFFVNSNVCAARVNTFSVTNMELDNSGTAFGLYVLDVPGAPEVKAVNSSDTESWFSWSWKPKGDRDFALQDFVVHAIPAT